MPPQTASSAPAMATSEAQKVRANYVPSLVLFEVVKYLEEANVGLAAYFLSIWIICNKENTSVVLPNASVLLIYWLLRVPLCTLRRNKSG